jgi:hypothetical protein
VSKAGLTPDRHLFGPVHNQRKLPEARINVLFFVRSQTAFLLHENSVLANISNASMSELNLFVIILIFSDVDVKGLNDRLLQVVQITLHRIEPVSIGL